MSNTMLDMDFAKKFIDRVTRYTEYNVNIMDEHGIDAFFPILRGVVTLQKAMDSANARKNMADTVEQVFRLMKI